MNKKNRNLKKTQSRMTNPTIPLSKRYSSSQTPKKTTKWNPHHQERNHPNKEPNETLRDQKVNRLLRKREVYTGIQ